MTHVVALVLIITGSAYLFITIALSRRKRAVDTSGAIPERFIFVVPALDEEAVIESTVNRLLAACGDRGRVLVIDDGSTDATGQILEGIRSERLSVLTRTKPNAQMGKGAALNDAYRTIRAQVLADGIDPHQIVLCIVDADGRLAPDVLDHVAPYFSGPDVGAVQLLVRIRNRGRWLCRFQDYEFLVFSSLTQTAREHLGSVGLGGNGQFTRLAALMELGENPWTDCLTEDLDLGVRLAIAGWRNRFCDDTYVDQQGLTSIPFLLRQRTRWAHGHLQCWKLIPSIVRSQLPTITVLDLSYYLLAPAAVLASSAIFTGSTVLFAVGLVSNPRYYASAQGALFLAVIYLVSFGPSLYLATLYRRRSRDISRRSALLMAHLLALYNYIWYLAEWKAVARIVLRKSGWAKTRRTAETEVAAGEKKAPTAIGPDPVAPRHLRPHHLVKRETAVNNRILVCFGTRPEAIKMAPVIRALQAHRSLEPIVTVTGQHPAMVSEILDTFRITPDIDLKLHRPGQTLDGITSRALTGISDTIRALDPAAVVVQGDTTTTFAAGLASFYEQRPVVHVEAGLRTGDIHQPFPEEANRRLTTTLAALHLAATSANRGNLLLEGVPASQIAVVGNPVIDALHLAVATIGPLWDDPLLESVFGGTSSRQCHPTVLVTAHRRESWGEPLCNVARAIADVAGRHPNARFVWPLHPNPAVREWVTPIVSNLSNITLTGPASYEDFVRLLTKADVAVTDSGGVQEEAPALGVPVLVTRDVTERQEAVDSGAAVLVGTDPDRLALHLGGLLDHRRTKMRHGTTPSPFGDGLAGRRTAAAIAELLGVGCRMDDFAPTPMKAELVSHH